MAIFTVKSVAAGDELTHSYLPPRLLVRPFDERRCHLNFSCECSRCRDERKDQPQQSTHEQASDKGVVEKKGAVPSASCGGDESVSDDAKAGARGMSWPDGFASTDAGKAVAAFKVATIAGSGSALSPEAVLEMGHAAVTAATSVLATRPLAALDLCLAYLAAFWRAPDARGAGHAGAAAGMCCTAAAELAARSAIAPARKRVPTFALELLSCCAAVTAYVVPGAMLREHSVPSLLTSLQRLRAVFGGTFAFLRDDTAIAGSWLDLSC